MRGRLDAIRERMARACESVGRDPESVTLVSISKTFGIDAVREAYDLGLRDFGESRLQEALPKIEALPKDIRWHYVGKLQSNKAKRAADIFNIIHTLESSTQLREIEKAQAVPDILIEVNIASEAQKSGVLVENVDEFVQLVLHCNHVHLRGLMTIGPLLTNPEAMRPYFRRMREMKERLGLDWLSMGMSGDFEVAIQEGASHIRVGTALFGGRT